MARLRSRIHYALLVAVAFAVADAALVQWTAYTVDPLLVGMMLAAALAVMACLAVVSALGTAIAGRGAAWIVGATALGYHVLRLRSLGQSATWWLWAVIALAVAVPVWIARRGGDDDRRAAGVAVIAAAALVPPVWVVGLQSAQHNHAVLRTLAAQHWIGFPGRTMILSLVVFLAVAALMHRVYGRGTGVHRFGPADPCAALMVGVGLLAMSYPAAPGFSQPDPGIQSGGSSDHGTARAGAATTEARAHPAPRGVVVVVLDTVRADHTSAYGYRLPTTPTLERLAAEGVRYERAWTPAPWSLSAHASLLTGLLPHQHGATRILVPAAQRGLVRVTSAPLAETYVTLAERLSADGIRTGLFAANHGYLSRMFGLTQGFEFADSRARNLVMLETIAAPFLRRGPRLLALRYFHTARSEVPASVLSERVDEWLEGKEEDRFFVLVNLMEAHPPSLAELYSDRYPEIAIQDSRALNVRDYDFGIREADEGVARLAAMLEDRGLLEETLLIVTSDHGETFFDDGTAFHGATLLESEVRVPLVMRGPGVVAGRVETGAASLTDISATVLEAFGLPVPPNPWSRPLPASDRPVFMQLWYSAERGRRFESTPRATFAEDHPTTWGMVEGDTKVLLSSAGDLAAYRLGAEGETPVDDPELTAAMEIRLRRLLGEEAFHLGIATSADSMSPEARERLRALGYIQ